MKSVLSARVVFVFALRVHRAVDCCCHGGRRRVLLKELIIAFELALSSVCPERAFRVLIVNFEGNAEVVNMEATERVGHKLQRCCAADVPEFKRLKTLNK